MNALRGRPWWQWVIAAFVGLTVLGFITGAGEDEEPASTTTVVQTVVQEPSATTTEQARARTVTAEVRTVVERPPTEVRVIGTFDSGCPGPLGLGCSNTEAADRMRVSDVFCTWRGSDVVVHLKIRNGMNAKVKYSIVPRYSIHKGGQHGTSLGSDQDVTVPAASSRALEVNAGHPKGVPDGIKISSCSPKLQDADLTD